MTENFTKNFSWPGIIAGILPQVVLFCGFVENLEDK